MSSAKTFAFDHCMPIDQAKGLDCSRIWTAGRDREMWALQED